VRASRNVIFAEPVDERVRDRVTAVREGLEAVVFLGLGRLACLVLVVSAWRARSESTASALRCSRRARSLTASSTSSSSDKVVRKHLMLSI